MAILLHMLLWPILLLTTGTSAPSNDVPPALSLPDLTLSQVVTVMDVQGADAVVVRKPDSSYFTVRLAGLIVDENDSLRREIARKFLHNVLAGERVWLVHADASKPAGSDRYYVYRWPDKLLVNLEMVRQGCADSLPEKTAPQPVVRVFVFWRDQARLYHKGVWAVVTSASTSASATLPPASAPATQLATQAAQVLSQVAHDRTIVYVGASGKKYHLASCKALRSTKTPKTLDEARKTHEPCRQCNPPK